MEIDWIINLVSGFVNLPFWVLILAGILGYNLVGTLVLLISVTYFREEYSFDKDGLLTAEGIWHPVFVVFGWPLFTGLMLFLLCLVCLFVIFLKPIKIVGWLAKKTGLMKEKKVVTEAAKIDNALAVANREFSITAGISISGASPTIKCNLCNGDFYRLTRLAKLEGFFCDKCVLSIERNAKVSV